MGLCAGRSVEQVIDALPQLLGTERPVIDLEVRKFVDVLLNEGVIVPSDPVADPQEWLPAFPGEFVQPRIERFDDLRDLLLMDPIHDVGEDGWPLRAGDAR